MRVLVTGYEPFDERGYNTSSDVLERLPRRFSGMKLFTATLPVVWRRAGGAIADLVARHRPEVAIALGMSREAQLGLERIAVNFQTRVRPDNDQQLPRTERIEASGPPAYFTTLDIDAAHTALTERRFESTISGWAGGYLCNFAFYRLAHLQAQDNGLRQAGFVHVPPRPDDGGWSLERLHDALQCLLEAAID